MLFRSGRAIAPGCISVGPMGICVSYGKDW